MPGLDRPRDFRQWMRWVERRMAEHDWRIAGNGTGAVPIGTVTRWGGSTPPGGWLTCDGSTFSSTTYPILADVLGGTTLPTLTGTPGYIIKAT